MGPNLIANYGEAVALILFCIGFGNLLLQKNLITPVFGIEDPRTDKRIDFVGGIRGRKELEKRCAEDMEAI